VADIDDKVMQVVEAELKKNPDATVDELLDVAKKVNKSVTDLTKRQFHARYPLQVKRKLNPPKKRSSRKKKSRRSKRGSPAAPNGSRDQVREIFLRFASDLAAAEERKAVVRVVAGVDKYVDEVLKLVD
jgi:hypothetical protein